MRKVVWNKLAKRDYFANIDFLLSKWTEKEAQKFVDEVAELKKFLRKGMLFFKKLM
jgi:plasmid stabilization system protein ParE